jgi:mRNA-degrading endonuclease RelE of RelBE toxin-antitoxin system
VATVELSNRAKKDLRAISPGPDAARIVEALGALGAGAANLDVTALEGRAPWLRLRVGNYRVLYRPIEGGWWIGRIVNRRDLLQVVKTL